MNSEQQQQAPSHTKHPYQAATSIIHISCQLPASRMLPHHPANNQANSHINQPYQQASRQ